VDISGTLDVVKASIGVTIRIREQGRLADLCVFPGGRTHCLCSEKTGRRKVPGHFAETDRGVRSPTGTS